MATVEGGGVRASIGFASKTGPRKANEDFAGAVVGCELPEPRQEVVAAIADTGALDYARQRAQQESDAAAAAISRLPNSTYKDSLLQLASFAVTRTY